MKPNPVQQNARWLVVGVLRNQFAPECFGEDGRLQAIEQCASALGFGFEAIRTGEYGFDFAD